MEFRQSKRLLVEGPTDQYSIIGIVRLFIPWGEKVEEAPVAIEAMGGKDAMLKAGRITSRLKSAEISTLGLVVDANSHMVQSYESLREICVAFFPEMPAQIPRDGLVTSNSDGKRLGIWIMPDNSASGYLETFLQGLIPQDGLWQHAVNSADRAKKEFAAPYHLIHTDKASFYTWLAWQDDPGRPPGIALRSGSLDAQSLSGSAFVAWFRRLYQL